MIEVKNLKRFYQNGEVIVRALNGVSFTVKKGEFVAIMGPSGSGKTTLLRILGLLDEQTSGDYLLNKFSLTGIPEDVSSHYRLTQLGYIFQEYALIDELTALENIYILSMMEGKSKLDSIITAQMSLEKVGLGDKGNRLESQLSGGERQRVAIARSIAKKPKILFADEPCANLDTKSSAQVLEVFRMLNKKYGQTIVMVTHEPWHTKYVSRVINMRDGIIVSDRKMKRRG